MAKEVKKQASSTTRTDREEVAKNVEAMPQWQQDFLREYFGGDGSSRRCGSTGVQLSGSEKKYAKFSV